MRFVAARYNVISSWDLVRALRDGKALPPRALIITFDDGYRCFKDTALPILRRLNLPATLFVPTGFPGGPGRLFWWDAVHRALTRTQEPQIEVPDLGVLPLTTPAERRAAYDRLVPLVERTPEAAAGRLVLSRILSLAGPMSIQPANPEPISAPSFVPARMAASTGLPSRTARRRA